MNCNSPWSFLISFSREGDQNISIQSSFCAKTCPNMNICNFQIVYVLMDG